MSDLPPSEVSMSSSRPYMVRAIHQWITDNQLTPYIVVDATQPLVTVPQQHVSEGKIVLNCSYDAVSALSIENEWISFNARFGGVSEEISFPPHAVRAIYASENGQGMVFPEGEQEDPPPAEGAESERKKGRPALKIVK